MAKVVAFRGKKSDAPDNVMRKVPTRPKNQDVRSREYLLRDEVAALMKAAGQVGRHRLRDQMLILVAYRHGLRVSELVGLRWDQFDLKRGQVHINRLKNGSASTHPIEGDELRLLRRIRGFRLALFRRTLGTSRFSTRFAIRSYHPRPFSNSGHRRYNAAAKALSWLILNAMSPIHLRFQPGTLAFGPPNDWFNCYLRFDLINIGAD